MKKLLDCVKEKQVNHSISRERVFRVLSEAHECLTVHQIMKIIKEAYQKKISVNTVYRHLNLFVSCNLVVVIQDDYKRAYYCLKKEEQMVFTICTKCKKVQQLKKEILNQCQEIYSFEFITIHKRCQKCT
jgi:Fe2+ or Zn2+ uptake regulation protein